MVPFDAQSENTEQGSDFEYECSSCERPAIERPLTRDFYWCGGDDCKEVIQAALVSSNKKLPAKRRMTTEINDQVQTRMKLAPELA